MSSRFKLLMVHLLQSCMMDLWSLGVIPMVVATVVPSRSSLRMCCRSKLHHIIISHGNVAAWGDPDWGGDSSTVQEQLVDVQQIQASGGGAFSAILRDGSVVSWNDRW